MARQFFSGNSIEQAVMAAARHYKVEPERLAYKLRDKKHGFLNIRRRVVIEVDPENLQVQDPEPVVEAPAAAPQSEAVAEPEMAAEEDSENVDQGDDPLGDEPLGDEPRDDDAEDDEAEDDEAEDGDPDGDVSGEHVEEHVTEDEDLEDEDSEHDDLEDEDPEDEDDVKESGSQDRGRSRGGRGRGRRSGGGRKNQRRRDVKIEEFFWDDDADGWDTEDVEEGDSQELAAVELCVERILDVMDLEIEYTITERDSMDIEFSGEDSEFLTEDNGKVLKAIEHIVPRMVRGLIGRSVAVNADCEGFRADHENSLRDLAGSAAEEVARTGKPKTLSPMNPADRRIVHLTLVDHADVETVSQGHGFMKRVKILPSDD